MLQVTNVPVISTGHLDSKTAKFLAKHGDDNDYVICAAHQEGFFLWVNSVIPTAPQCIQDLSAWANLNGFDWVRLDADAEAVQGLRTYDW